MPDMDVADCDASKMNPLLETEVRVKVITPFDLYERETMLATPVVPVVADEELMANPLQRPETVTPGTLTPSRSVTFTLACTIRLPFRFTPVVRTIELTFKMTLGLDVTKRST